MTLFLCVFEIQHNYRVEFVLLLVEYLDQGFKVPSYSTLDNNSLGRHWHTDYSKFNLFEFENRVKKSSSQGAYIQKANFLRGKCLLCDRFLS